MGITRSLAEFVMPAAESGNINVEAVLAAAAGNAPVGVILSLVSPIAGLGSASERIDGAGRRRGYRVGCIVAGTAAVAHSESRPEAGTSEDYEFWSETAHPDVTRAWGRPLAGGLGTVTVYFMTDDATTDGIPNAATVTTVDAYIQARRPVTADVTVAGPTAQSPSTSRSTTSMPSTQAVMDAIEAELADLIRRESEPGGTLLVSHIREAISTSAGRDGS